MYIESYTTYKQLQGNRTELPLEAYTNADYARSIVDRKSTTRYCTFLGENLVTWKSKKQNVVARSNVEVEYHAMAQEIYELFLLKIILENLKIKWDTLYDFIATISWSLTLHITQYNMIEPSMRK